MVYAFNIYMHLKLKFKKSYAIYTFQSKYYDALIDINVFFFKWIHNSMQTSLMVGSGIINYNE